MHLGWKQDHPPLKQGVAEIAKIGPDSNDVRWNFFGTNVLFQFKDEKWNAWNPALRDALIDVQADDGVAKGSWFFAGGDGAHTGGRLYHTALTTMTLEVYYRHLPIYRQADDEPFPF